MPRMQTPGVQTPGASPPVHPRLMSHPLPRSIRPTSHHRLGSFSLLGALEFRSVVTSLRRDSAASVLSAFESYTAPGGHHHLRSHLSPRESTVGFDTEYDTSRSPVLGEYRMFSTPPPDSIHHIQSLQSSPKQIGTPVSPRSLSSLSPSDGAAPSPPISSPGNFTAGIEDSLRQSKKQQVLTWIGRIAHVLFPTLQHLRNKNVLGIVVSILAAPAVLLLTITLPVVISHRPNETKSEELLRDGRLIDFEGSGNSMEQMIDDAEEGVQNELHGLVFNKWLTVTQSILGPLFVVAVCFGQQPYALWVELATFIAGVLSAVLIVVFSENGNSRARLALCLTGFAVSMVWIMAIADEVVQVLDVCPLLALFPAILTPLHRHLDSYLDFLTPSSASQYLPWGIPSPIS